MRACRPPQATAETPLDDWIFAPRPRDPRCWKTIFGVLSLEGFGLFRQTGSRCGGRRNPLLRPFYSARDSQPCGIASDFYERQTCLVLDAVTVRNLETDRTSFFTGADAGVTLFPLD